MKWFISSHSTRYINALKPLLKAKDGKDVQSDKRCATGDFGISRPMRGDVNPQVDKAVNEFAARGFRSLGVARAEGDGKWQFIGVLPLFDPPREDAKATIATAFSHGSKD